VTAPNRVLRSYPVLLCTVGIGGAGVTVVTGLSAMSDISKGSVTTTIRCGGIFSLNVTTHFLLIPPVKKV